MKLSLSYRLLAFTMALVWGVAALGCLASAAPRPQKKEKEHEGKNIDSGSFGVFLNGRRVGTETFSIDQTGSGSVIRSEFKTDNAATPAVQNSELQLTAAGEIQRYEWKELSPEQAELQVLPNDDFLTQKSRSGPQGKEHEQPYLLSLSTSILDDYFFIHREVLAWKFLATACKQEKGQLQCPIKQHTQFATLNPHEQASASLDAEFIGREKVALKTGQRELFKLEFKTDAGTWQLWLDEHDQFKLMRISILGENTAVERD